MNIDDLAAQLKERVTALSPAEQDELSRAVAKAVPEKWVPQPGPQTEAYFSKADELLYGGAAGGGKTDLLVGLALNTAYNAVIFRDGFKNVTDLQSRAVKILGSRDGLNATSHFFNLGGERSLEFGSLEKPYSEKDWQGRRRDFMGFDETAQMNRKRVAIVLGWNGSAVEGVERSRAVFATNPPLSDEGNFLITWFAPWLDPLFPDPAKAGELRWFVSKPDEDADPIWVSGPGYYFADADTETSADEEYERLYALHGYHWPDHTNGRTISKAKTRTFIPARLADNRFLRDTDYIAQIMSRPEPLRSALLNGNFMAARTDNAWQLIPSDWARAAQARWTPDGRRSLMVSLGVDVAGGGPDREVIARLHENNWFDEPLIHKGVDTKDGRATAGRIVTAQRNKAPIGIDMTGGWGGGAKVALEDSEVDVLPLVFSTVTGAICPQTKRQFGNLRAEMYWMFRLALDPTATEKSEYIALPPGARILAEFTSVRWFEQSGKIWVESKEDIKDRIGVSTDIFDAYVIAWHARRHGLAKAKRGGRRHQMEGVAAEADPFSIDGF